MIKYFIKNNQTIISNQTSRRDFITKSTLLAAGASLSAGTFPASGKVLGANDKIRTGFIGVGNRGSQLMGLFMNNPDCEVAALCDAYDPYMSRNRNEVHPRYIADMGGQIPRMGEKFPNKPTLYKDWRKLLEDKGSSAIPHQEYPSVGLPAACGILCAQVRYARKTQCANS